MQRLHTEDIVCNPENPDVIGVVTRVHNDEEFEEDEDEYEEDDAPLEPGQVEVCWIGQPESASDGNQEEQDNQEIVDSSKLTLVDRSLMHGDLVGLSSNPLGQSGTVVDVDLSVDLKLSNGTLLQDVSAKRLGHIRKFSVGCYVMYQQWLGKIEEVLDDLVICFEDGGMCEVKDVAYPVVVPVTLFAADDENMCPYWPGQVSACRSLLPMLHGIGLFCSVMDVYTCSSLFIISSPCEWSSIKLRLSEQFMTWRVSEALIMHVSQPY